MELKELRAESPELGLDVGLGIVIYWPGVEYKEKEEA